MSELLAMLSKQFSYDSQQMALVKPYIKQRIIHKNESFLLPGQICPSVAYIKKGSCYGYKTKQDKLVIDWLYVQGDIVLDIGSFFNQVPSERGIRVTESLEVEELTFHNIQTLYTNFTFAERVARRLMEKTLIEFSDLYWSARYDTFEEKYERLIRDKPEVLQQFPQFIIASYLGITPVGLSKLRKRLMVKG